jgi:hypothetical protein
MHKLRYLATAAAIGLTLAGCAAPAASGPSSRPSPGGSGPPPLKSEVGTQYVYTLNDLTSCEVGDAMAIAINQASEPLRVTGAAVTVTGHGDDQRSYQLAAVRPGFSGELTSGSHLAALAGYQLEPAAGALLSPVSARGQGYVFVVRLHVRGEHPKPWSITGLTVHYQLRQKSYSAFFPQKVELPPARCPQ